MDNDKKQNIFNFKRGLEELNISLKDKQIEQFMTYYELLIEKNKLMNLTAITELTEVIYKHFLDSLSIVKVLRPEKENILDVGTGAGLPGIPLKIAFPNTRLVLMDSLNKRVRFLDEVIEKLNLNDTSEFHGGAIAIHGRAEDYGRDKNYREAFDICTSRAVARLSTLSEYCIPFVKVGGCFISYKSGNISEELKEAEGAINLLGGSIIKAREFNLPHKDIRRVLIHIEKTKNTPKKYPRTAGKPSKEPLYGIKSK